MRLQDAFGTILGISKKSCPDCGATLMSDGSCPDCGYGEEGDMEEMDSEEEGVEIDSLLEVRDELQRLIGKIDKLIKQA